MRKIEVINLTFAYDGGMHGRNILNNVSWSANGNETIGIIGANGAGKSTMLKILVGLLSGYSGTVETGGLLVQKENLKRIRQLTGYLFQDSDSQLFMPTVFEDVAFAPRNYGFSKAEVEAKTLKALEQVGMTDFKERQIYRLSGGQKKLVSIATLLSIEPDIILMDEPSIALDPRNRRNLIRIINELDALKVIASHDLDLIADTCSRILLISEGRIVKYGNTDDILRDKELLENHGLELPLSFSRREK